MYFLKIFDSLLLLDQLALPLQHGDDQDNAAALQESPRHASDSFEQEASKPRDKIQRRLAQNREAARKSRLRKKAYIQNLETSRMKLAHLEQEITRARQQVRTKKKKKKKKTSL
jgi:hypothetical protein